jgi:hypothetical protein
MPIFEPLIRLSRRTLPFLQEAGEAVVPRVKAGQAIKPPIETAIGRAAQLGEEAAPPPPRQVIRGSTLVEAPPPEAPAAELPEILPSKDQIWDYLSNKGFRIELGGTPEELVARHVGNSDFAFSLKPGDPVIQRRFLDTKIQEAARAAIEAAPQTPLSPLHEMPPTREAIPEPGRTLPRAPVSAATETGEAKLRAAVQIPHYSELSERMPKRAEMNARLAQLAKEDPAAYTKYKQMRRQVPPSVFFQQRAIDQGVLPPDPTTLTKAEIRAKLKELSPGEIRLYARSAGRASRLHALEQAELFSDKVLSPLREMAKAGTVETVKGRLPGAFNRVLASRHVMERHPITAAAHRAAVLLGRDHRRKVYVAKNQLHSILKRYRIDDRADLEPLSHYLSNYGDLDDIQRAAIPPNIRRAAEEIFKLNAKIYVDVKSVDPAVGYIRDYFPRMWVKREAVDLRERLKGLEEQLEEIQTMRISSPAHAEDLRRAASEIQSRINKLEAAGTKMDAIRLRELARGGSFGNLTERRVLKEVLPEESTLVPKHDSITGLLEDYIEGAYRKRYFDQLLPMVKDSLKNIPQTAELASLRNYTWDWINAQRGMLGVGERSYLAQSISNLSGGRISPEKARTAYETAIDGITTLQYLLKIGTSWIRFPLVNASQNILTYSLAGPRAYFNGVADALQALQKNSWREARYAGAITPEFTPLAEISFQEMLKRHGTMKGVFSVLERAGWAPKFSEDMNRAFAYHVGIRMAKEGHPLVKILGYGEGPLRGKNLMNFALDIVDRTQWAYNVEQMPLITRTPMGKLAFQFRSYSSFYLNYLNDLWKNKLYTELGTSLLLQAALTGAGVLPLGSELWEAIRNHAMTSWGVDLPRLRPIESLSRAIFRGPGISMEKSIEPWNPPGTVEQLFGPTLGPIIGGGMAAYRGGEDWQQWRERFPERLAPPLTRLLRPAARAIQGEPPMEARTDPSKKFPMGRKIGERSIPEMLYLGKTLEQWKHEIQTDMEHVYLAQKNRSMRGASIGRKLRELTETAKTVGMAPGMIKQMKQAARARATKEYYRDIGEERAERFKRALTPPK